MNHRRTGTVLLILGAALLTAALLLFVRNTREDRQAEAAAESALEAVQAEIRSRISIAREQNRSEKPEADVPPKLLTVVSIDGNDYIGYLTIPNLGVDLPIMAELSMDRLNVAPCLQYGSPLTDDAVIAAHNYPSHFRPLHNIAVGETVIYMDMSGYTIEYTVSEVRTVPPDAIDEVCGSGHDLVLYTCTLGGASRVAVYCDRIAGIHYK